MTEFKISEDDLQANCIYWFRAQYSRFYWRMASYPNGGKRNVREAVKLKKTGTLSGAWDLFLSIPRNGYSGMYIEMKVGKNKLTDNQVKFRDANILDYFFVVCYCLEDFKTQIDKYLK